MKKIALVAVFSVAAIGTTTNATNFNYSFVNSEDDYSFINSEDDYSFDNNEENSFSFDEKSGIYLQNGRLYVNGELQHDNFSIMQSEFAFLYFYVPSKGLFIISNNEFEGATQAGNFQKNKLVLDIDGVSLVVKSSTKILPESEETSVAWVKYDSTFSLNTKAVIVGYGGDTKVPYKWKNQMKFKED